MADDVYIPDEGDWKDWDELVEKQRSWNKRTFTLNIKSIPKEVTREQFIAYLRRAIVDDIQDYSTRTRREIVAYLDGKFQVKDELRRYCDLSEVDFDKMLDGSSFPYLDQAWNSLFHIGILQDIAETRRVFHEPEDDIQSKRGKSFKAKKSIEKTSEKVEDNVKKRSNQRSYTASIDDEVLSNEYTLNAFLNNLARELKFNKTTALTVNNSMKVAWFIEKIRLLYTGKTITLKEFTEYCTNDRVPVNRLDRMLSTKHLFTNIMTGSINGSRNGEMLKALFKKVFGVELVLN